MHPTLTRRRALQLLAAACAACGREHVPAIGLGTWQTFDVGDSAGERAPLAQVLTRCLAAGGQVIDHLDDNVAAGRGRVPDEAQRRRIVEAVG
jgi:hypothetical protein